MYEKTLEDASGAVYKSSARIRYLHDSLGSECLFLLVPVSRHDDGARLLQSVLTSSIGEALSYLREKGSKKEGRRERHEKQSSTVASVLIIAVALALPAKRYHVDRDQIRELNPRHPRQSQVERAQERADDATAGHALKCESWKWTNSAIG